jgi:hypothetical protein
MSSGNGLSSNPNAEERGEYGQVSLQEPSEDVAEIKKAAATAPPAGLLNHPGTPQSLNSPMSGLWLIPHFHLFLSLLLAQLSPSYAIV